MAWNSKVNVWSVFVFVLIALLIGQVATAGQTPADPDRRAFDQDYKKIQGRVSTADLSPEIGERAKELRFALNQALIEISARIETLKLEAAEFEGERQQEALDNLLQLGAERQRVIAHARHQLEALAGSTGPVPPVTPLISGMPGDDRLVGTKQDPLQYDTDRIEDLRRLIGINLEPEDVTTGEFE